MACFSCGETFPSDVKSQLAKYKEQYDTLGIKRVYYVLEKGGEVFITRTDSFFGVIKPLLFTKKAIKNGADFALIQEFGQTSDSHILGNNQNQ